MAGQRTGRSRFGFKMVLLAVLCCALHLKDLKAYRTLAVPGAGAPNRAELQKMKKAELKKKLREKGANASGMKAELIERLMQPTPPETVQTPLATEGKAGERNRRVLPPLAEAANPKEHVYIPLRDYGRKMEELFQGEVSLFIRGGVGVGKTTLRFHLAPEYPERFVSVPFSSASEQIWTENIIEAVENATQTKLRGTLEKLFESQSLCTLLFKSDKRPKLLLLSASGEANATMTWTTPSEIKQKVFWTPPVPEPLDDLINQLEEADVRLDQSSVEFFLKLCGGHRSIFIAAMQWVREEQKGEPWDFRTVVSKVQDSSATRDWSAEGTFLGALAVSRGVRVNGKYTNLDMVSVWCLL